MPPVRKTIEEIDRESERIERSAIDATRGGKRRRNRDEMMFGKGAPNLEAPSAQQIGALQQLTRRVGAAGRCQCLKLGDL
jgi:hypothetical protein